MVSVGNLEPDYSDISSGFLFATWPDNPEGKEWKQSAWLAMSPPVTNVWAAAPLYVDQYDTQVWKHECFTVDWASGGLELWRGGARVATGDFETIRTMAGLQV